MNFKEFWFYTSTLFIFIYITYVRIILEIDEIIKSNDY